ERELAVHVDVGDGRTGRNQFGRAWRVQSRPVRITGTGLEPHRGSIRFGTIQNAEGVEAGPGWKRRVTGPCAGEVADNDVARARRKFIADPGKPRDGSVYEHHCRRRGGEATWIHGAIAELRKSTKAGRQAQ